MIYCIMSTFFGTAIIFHRSLKINDMAIEDSVLLIDIDVVFMQLLTVITTIDDLNYPEKTLTYYIVNAPYVFSACWKVHLPAFYSD